MGKSQKSIERSGLKKNGF